MQRMNLRGSHATWWRGLRWPFVIAAALMSLCNLTVVHAAPDALPASIASTLDAVEVPRDAVVAMVQEVGSRRTRLTWQPDQSVSPASLTKLLTTFAGLDLLGPAWTWATPVWLQGSVHDGVLDGNLIIKGSGDPKLVVERIWLMFKRVQQLGVREIHGDIVLDRSAFFAPKQFAPDQGPADFDGEPSRPYNVRADALMVNYKALVLTFTPDPAHGVAQIAADPPLAGVQIDTSVPLTAAPCVDWRTALRAEINDPTRIHFTGGYPSACAEQTWPIAYADPKSFNARALLGIWQDMGGRVTGSVREGFAPDSKPTFESISPTLAEVIRDINKYSNNVMAQQLFLTLGLAQGGAGTPQAARAVMQQWAAERLGADAIEGLVIDNGSGLSRDARVTAKLMNRLLQVAWTSPVMPELMSSLPVSGIDGTLKRSRATLGRAHLKTGSLRDVAGIAGYVLADSGRRYVVVAIINHPNANAAGAFFDALVRWTAADASTGASPDR
jgi:D-alanyl-D-alanine carboxypeptidase/D-alanyl-D-alanine-endopeptidase (penicillin-binding protein 4)